MATSADEALRVLLLDSDGESTVLRALRGRGLDVSGLDDLTGLPAALRSQTPDVVLVDLRRGPSLDTLDAVLDLGHPLPVVAMGTMAEPDLDLAVIERGAEDFLELPMEADRLAVALRLATVRFRTRTPPAAGLHETPQQAPGRLHPLWKLEPGTAVDRYEVERIVGRGGMAVVYRVRHRKLGSIHALKVVLPTGGGEATRLMIEGQAQARLRHPNLVSATDVLELDPGVGLVMEFVEGPTLQEWMENGTATGARWLGLFRGIVRGLRHAHAHGLVHRDLKPANVLLLETADGFVPKIADFGIARELPANEGPTPDGEPVLGVGTIGFAAPEQYGIPSTVDPRSDLFSLGCLLYLLACGVPAFGGREPHEVIRATRRGSYRPPRELVPELPERLSVIVAGLLAVDPERRTPNCQTLLEQLDELDVGALPDRQPGSALHPVGETLDVWALDAVEAPWTTGWQPDAPEGTTS
ncbi:MAG: protein kinase [Myxococcota bacterium]